MKKLNKLIIIFCLLVNSLQSQVQLGQELYGDEINDYYGRVDISADGSRMVVAAGGRHLRLDYFGESEITTYARVYEYDTNNNKWNQLGNDIIGEKPYSYFGDMISISGDGNRIAIGDNGNEAYNYDRDQVLVRVYDYNGSNWVQIGQDFKGNDNLTTSPTRDVLESLALSYDGNRLAISKRVEGRLFNTEYVFPEDIFPGGHVEIYDYDGTDWLQIDQTIYGESINLNQRIEEGLVGYSVEVSPDGNHVIIGVRNILINGEIKRGRVRVYEKTIEGWTKVGKDIVPEIDETQVGSVLSISTDGSIIAFNSYFSQGQSSEEYIWVFKFNPSKNKWEQLGSKIIGYIGNTISLSGDGQKVVIGNPHYGDLGNFTNVYRFNNKIDDWEQTCIDIYGELFSLTNFVSLSTDGRTLAIGETFADGPNGKTRDNIGRVRVFDVSTKVTGTVLFDIAENGCASMTNPAANAQITITNDFETVTISTDNNGNYIGYLGGFGNYTISVAINGYSESKIYPILDCEENIVNFCIPNNYFDTVTVDTLSSASGLEGTDLTHTVTMTAASSIIKTYIFLLRDQTTEYLTDYTTAIFSDNVTYNETLGLLIVPAGVSSFTIAIPTIDDLIFEEDEFYNITMGNITATGTIFKNDTVINPTVSNETVIEGADLVHTINVDGIFTTERTYSYSLIDNTTNNTKDYSTPIISDNVSYNPNDNLITIPAGIDSFTVTISTIDDELYEGEEYYTITFDGISGTGIIRDNDGLPKYFTPNNDGINDTWPYDLIDGNYLIDAKIYVYNRYGKLIKLINQISNGWDGTYNGIRMPEDTYWYRLTMPNGKAYHGHFSLKR